MRDLRGMRQAVTNRLPDKITKRLPGGSRQTSRLGPLRTPAIVTAATFGAVLLASAGKLVLNNRLKAGESLVQRVHPLGDGRTIVVLSDTTFVVEANDAVSVTEIAKPGVRVGYAVTRWSLSGIPAGRIFALDGDVAKDLQANETN